MVTEKHKYKYKVCRDGFEGTETVSDYNKTLIIDFVENKGDKCLTGNFPYSHSCMRINCLKWLAGYFKGKDLDKLTHNELLICGREFRRSNKWKKQYKKKWCAIINSFFAFLCGRDVNKLNNLIYDEYNDKVFNIGIVQKSDKKEKPLLTHQEIEKLVTNAKIPTYAYYFAMMFDSGMRIEEFLSLRFKDIKKKTQEGNTYYEVHIWYGTKIGDERDIALTLYPNVITEYLESRKKELKDKYNEDDKVFSYQSIHSDCICNKFIKVEVDRILKRDDAKKFHNHSIRHSSATYYYCDLEFSDAYLEARFGWGPKSSQRREYVQLRNNISKKQIREMRKSHGAVRNEEITYEFQKYKEETKKQKEAWIQTLEEMKANYEELIKKDLQEIKEDNKKELEYQMNKLKFESIKNQKLYDLILNIAKEIPSERRMEEVWNIAEKIDYSDYDDKCESTIGS